MPMIPPEATHQEKKVRFVKGKLPVFYEPPRVRDARGKLTANLAKHAPTEPLTGPVGCLVKWLFPITNKQINGQWRDRKPDTHYLNKLLFDVMTSLGYWTDDAQVVSEIIQKFWSLTPGIYIELRELHPTEWATRNTQILSGIGAK